MFRIRSAIPSCTGAEETVAEGLYVSWLQGGAVGPNIVKTFYLNLIALNAANPTWSGPKLYHQALVSTSPDPKAKQLLMAQGCEL